MCRILQAQRLPSLCYSFVNLFLVNIYRIFSTCQALYLEFCMYSLNFPNEAHYVIYIFQNRKLNFREMKLSILNHTGRIQDSKKSPTPFSLCQLDLCLYWSFMWGKGNILLKLKKTGCLSCILSEETN